MRQNDCVQGESRREVLLERRRQLFALLRGEVIARQVQVAQVRRPAAQQRRKNLRKHVIVTDERQNRWQRTHRFESDLHARQVEECQHVRLGQETAHRLFGFQTFTKNASPTNR